MARRDIEGAQGGERQMSVHAAAMSDTSLACHGRIGRVAPSRRDRLSEPGRSVDFGRVIRHKPRRAEGARALNHRTSEDSHCGVTICSPGFQP